MDRELFRSRKPVCHPSGSSRPLGMFSWSAERQAFDPDDIKGELLKVGSMSVIVTNVIGYPQILIFAYSL